MHIITKRENGQKFVRIWYASMTGLDASWTTWYPVENLRGLKCKWGFVRV